MGPTGSRTIVPAGSNFTGPGARGQLASVFRGEIRGEGGLRIAVCLLQQASADGEQVEEAGWLGGPTC